MPLIFFTFPFYAGKGSERYEREKSSSVFYNGAVIYPAFKTPKK